MELSDIKGVGPKTLNILKNLKIEDLNDLLAYYPFRYDIYEPTTLNVDNINERIAINVVLETTPTVNYIRRNFNQLKFRAIHNNKPMYIIIFNRAFLKPHLNIGKTVTIIGKYNNEKNTFICDDLKYLDVINLGRDQAINLGIDYDKLVRKLFVTVAIFISISTALVGPITFLGLLVVNLSRQMINTYKHKYLITMSVLLSVFVLVTGQLLAERIFDFSTPVSVIINLIGGIYFMYLLLKESRI